MSDIPRSSSPDPGELRDLDLDTSNPHWFHALLWCPHCGADVCECETHLCPPGTLPYGGATEAELLGLSGRQEQ